MLIYCKTFYLIKLYNWGFFKLKHVNINFTICSDERRRDFLNFSLMGVTSMGLLLDRLSGVGFAGWPLGSESSVSRSSQEVSFPSLFRLKKKGLKCGKSHHKNNDIFIGVKRITSNLKENTMTLKNMGNVCSYQRYCFHVGIFVINKMMFILHIVIIRGITGNTTCQNNVDVTLKSPFKNCYTCTNVNFYFHYKST